MTPTCRYCNATKNTQLLTDIRYQSGLTILNNHLNTGVRIFSIVMYAV